MDTTRQSSGRFEVVIAGGGIAALEAALALRDLAGDRVRTTLLAPEPRFGYRPASAREPVEPATSHRYSLAEIAEELGVEFRGEWFKWLDPMAGVVHTDAGVQLRYDALLLAVGAVRPERLTQGEMQIELAVTVLRPHSAPRAIFGEAASLGVVRRLGKRRIEIVTGVSRDIHEADQVALHAEWDQLASDRPIALSQITLDGVAAQQTDSAAASLAALAGAPITPWPVGPELDGLVLGGGPPRRRRLSATGSPGAGSDTVEAPGAPPAVEIFADHLARYLDIRAHGERPLASA